jgi:SSS family solute:Na+ symporter
VLFVVIGCLLAPALGHPQFKGVFNFIQEFQGYISPGIVAAFVIGIAVPRAPAYAGFVALALSAPIYGVLHLLFSDFSFSIYELHFLIRMAITFGLLAAVMLLMTAIYPLAAPRKMPEVKDFDATNSRLAMTLGGLVILAVLVFYVKFW